MREGEIIDRTLSPRTRETLLHDLRALGVQEGMSVLVHSSLSAIGWVSGGDRTVVDALMEVVSSHGTLIMPTHSGDLSDPTEWQNPPVPESWWQVIRDTMPPFDPWLTPTRGMGQIVESFRGREGVRRSNHPSVSFAAWGRHRDWMIDGHSLDFPLGEGSPLARLYEMDGSVLLLGVGHANNTSLHLAQYRSQLYPEVTLGAPIMREGTRVWAEYRDIDFDAGQFAELGANFELVHPVSIGPVGSGESRLFPQRAAVDYAVGWLTAHTAKPS